MNDIKLWDKEECYTCIHRHNQELEVCDEYTLNKGNGYDKQCEPIREAEATIKIVLCSKCKSIAEMCKCAKPKMTTKIV